MGFIRQDETGWKKCGYESIQSLKRADMLTLPWDYVEVGEELYVYVDEGINKAYIRISLDLSDDQVLFIDEFEVLREYRKLGLGKKAIRDLINNTTTDIRLLAKNRSVQKFWEKCNFVDDGISWDEIPLIYKRK